VGDVEAIMQHASVSARLRVVNGARPEIGREDIAVAARERTRRDLGKFARRIESRYTWDDLVLPEHVTRTLTDFYTAIRNRAQVYEGWGYGKKHVRGRGLSSIFWGESGTGKTMSAEVIALSLGVDLYQVDLATVVSKWVGETERNISQIFDASEGGDSILFFDEADALFGKRTEVKDAKDRYANIEVSYLLQRIETFDGIVILASNLRGHIDTAFLRRFQYGMFFPRPSEEARARIWRNMFPPMVPLDRVEPEHLAAEFDDLTGGQIKMVAIGAALLAAGEDRPVSMAHIKRAYETEREKMQRVVRTDVPARREEPLRIDML